MHDDPHTVCRKIAEAICDALPDARVEVTPQSPGHYAIAVESRTFAGKGLLEKQRMVYGAIAPLMSGEGAPVHAVDRLETRVPEA